MKILICDDEVHYLETLCIHVQKHMNNRFIDYDITTATSPSEIVIPLSTTIILPVFQKSKQLTYVTTDGASTRW